MHIVTMCKLINNLQTNNQGLRPVLIRVLFSFKVMTYQQICLAGMIFMRKERESFIRMKHIHHVYEHNATSTKSDLFSFSRAFKDLCEMSK